MNNLPVREWTWDRTASYLRYSRKCPKGVSPYRWRAMVRQIEGVLGFGWIAKF